MVFNETFTESWLDLTLSDPFQHSAVACDIVWQVLYKFLHDMIWFGGILQCKTNLA